MKSRRVSDFICIVVAAGWRRSDIVSVVKSFRHLSEYDLDSMIDNARASFEELRESFVTSEFDDVYRSPYVASVIEQDDVAEKISAILKDEARLSTVEAVSAMTAGLSAIDKIRANQLPGYSKKSFFVWIRRASEIFSASELLSVATSIRNSLMHGSQLDWGLRKK
jgi:hypothetical protein